VVAGINRNDIGLLVFPRLDDIRRRFDLTAEMSASAVLSSAAVLQHFQHLLDGLSQRGSGSANRPARLLLLAEPPQIDRSEITDKGSINQRAVLAHRALLVAHLWGEAPADVPLDPLPTVLRATAH
jgi:feruloyl-CoA synthase